VVDNGDLEISSTITVKLFSLSEQADSRMEAKRKVALSERFFCTLRTRHDIAEREYDNS
jgi:hypothetical protein